MEFIQPLLIVFPHLIIKYPRCGAINTKTIHGRSNLTNTVIIVPDVTLRGYKYKQKDNHRVSIM
jgi:hypothetical protein